MALNATTLATALRSAANCPPTDAAGIAVWNAIAAAIVSHITANAVVVAGTMTSPSGAVTGTGLIT